MFCSQYIIISCSNYRKIKIKWSYLACIRAKSTAEPKTKTYSHTIQFPNTNFPARSNNAQKEKIQKKARFSDLYNWQREHLKGPEFVLHDGPPYANGDLHIGHAVNKIIKDINNRSQILQGNKVHYVPGWDCHGLPIELKALQKAKKASKKNEPTDPVKIREIARAFALETVEKQKAGFESWGVMADWKEQCYLTLHKEYVKKQLHIFYEMYTKGLVFRALKPVYWSPSSRTALAEAELEYNPQYKSKEVYVTFPIETMPHVKEFATGKTISAIIWTTTPWTLVTNRAICYSPQLRYSFVSLSSKPGALFLVGSNLIEDLEKTLGVEFQKVVEFDGQDLKGATYSHGLLNKTFPFLEGEHVTAGKGTGLVHTAPAHGPEDFLVALKNNMPVECNVDEAGCYTNIGFGLDGLPVLTAGNDAVIALLEDSIVHQGVHVHAYPVDWRTKLPVIIRASQQWFIDTAALKERALESLEKVQILPPSSADQSRQGFRAQLEKRPYWCISRQRAWGVPIPALYEGDDVIVDERVINKLCELLESKGPEAWWTCDVAELLPAHLATQYAADGKVVRKGKDIMDIWLDSGLTWQTLGGRTAHLYSEGVDQLTGWFQASLLTSLALRNEAPYESIFVHGFVVDDKRRKMSKSLGNGVHPHTVIHGSEDGKHPAYGVDTLRWWVASHGTQHSQIVISKKLLEECYGEVNRIRNILKFLLGTISDMHSSHFDQKPSLNYFDAHIVNETRDFLTQINEHYNNFRYNGVAQTVLFFTRNKVSGLYCHCIKDRLYCSPKESPHRLSVQLVLNTILVSICKALAPILPHVVEEAWEHHPLYEKPFYFTQNIPILTANTVDAHLMEVILDLKKDICGKTKTGNLNKYVASVFLPSGLYEQLNALNIQDGVNSSVLCEILELSSVDLNEQPDGKWQIEVSESTRGQCLRCRKYNAEEDRDKCLRCEQAVASV